jgi:hypothetical protein
MKSIINDVCDTLDKLDNVEGIRIYIQEHASVRAYNPVWDIVQLTVWDNVWENVLNHLDAEITSTFCHMKYKRFTKSQLQAAYQALEQL